MDISLVSMNEILVKVFLFLFIMFLLALIVVPIILWIYKKREKKIREQGILEIHKREVQNEKQERTDQGRDSGAGKYERTEQEINGADRFDGNERSVGYTERIPIPPTNTVREHLKSDRDSQQDTKRHWPSFS